MRPGLTGLAQASGRNYVNWDKRFALDVEYVEHLSFAMDCRVIMMTVNTVLAHSEDVAEDTNAIEGNFADIRRRQQEAGKHGAGKGYMGYRRFSKRRAPKEQ